ncbi:MAG: DUF4197 domain-containing protein [Sulfurimonas sp.]|nr:DUF4197 domain-containing protein [Sulfurimonas sp.]
MKKTIIVSTIILSTSLLQSFDFGSLIQTATEITNNGTTQSPSTTKTTSELSSSIVSDGLKEALKNGVDYGVKELSKDGGYLNNASVKIPLPENLSKAESLIRSVGGDKIADDLINSMNNATTTAAPKTANILVNSIDDMSIDDAKNILAGDKDAATQYFKTHTTKDLQKMIKPIIQAAMKENNVASYYDTFNEYYGTYGKDLVKSSGLMDFAKSYGADQYIPQNTDENLDDYVTQKAIDGLFEMIATKEGEIRENPVAQTTSLLKQVFGN